VARLADAATLLEDRAEKRLNPAHLAMIKDWRDSSCIDPERYPSKAIAPNWQGPGSLCHSCASCRSEQRPPSGDWDDWLYMAGRGAGKTRSAAEYVAEALAMNTGWRVAVLAPTYADARDTCIEGESGLLAVFDRWGWVEGKEYIWNRSLGELRVRSTRSRVKLFSAEKPARLRGPQHHLAWVDELAQVVKAAADAWHMLKFGLRLGKHPKVIATTTPLPVALIKEMLVDPRCAVTRGTTDDNAANLPDVTLRAFHKKYDGTRLGRQELGGELLDDLPGALWKRAWLDDGRVKVSATAKWWEDEPEATGAAARAILAELADLGIQMVRVVVAVDPAVTSGEDADESGIIVMGRADDGLFYVLADYTIRETPDLVMARIIQAYDDWEANAVILETNNGGEYIPGMLQMACLLAGHTLIPTEMIRAKKAKRVRAEPVSAIYGQRQARHVGTHTHLEDQICVWVPEEVESPDRMDALVYGVLYLDDQGIGATMFSTASAATNIQIPRHQMQRGIPTTSVGSRR
jgi:phage terminase large subunit-like protein